MVLMRTTQLRAAHTPFSSPSNACKVGAMNPISEPRKLRSGGLGNVPKDVSELGFQPTSTGHLAAAGGLYTEEASGQLCELRLLPEARVPAPAQAVPGYRDPVLSSLSP